MLPIAFDVGLTLLRNVAESRNQTDRAATQTASLSQSNRTQGFTLPIDRLSSLRQEQQAAPMIASMHAERSENNRNMMSAMLRAPRATAA